MLTGPSSQPEPETAVNPAAPANIASADPDTEFLAKLSCLPLTLALVLTYCCQYRHGHQAGYAVFPLHVQHNIWATLLLPH